MSRTSNALFVCGSLLWLSCGCANFVETRTIEDFSTALKTEDLNKLKLASSGEFEQKALRLAEALDDFKILNLPDGETTVVKIEEVSPSQKHVTVEVGKSKRRLLYQLTLDPQTEKWVVDDIFVKQRRKGLTAAKSVTEQMDLLLTVREFLSAWGDGQREDVLAVTTPEFRDLLSELPPSYLAYLTRRIVGGSSTAAGRPEAQMDENIAIVRLPHSSGKMILSLELLGEHWKVSDLAVDSRRSKEHVPSARKLAAVLLASSHFLDAYEAEDKQALVPATTKSFYRGSLAPADLSMYPLANLSMSDATHQVQIRGNRADFLMQSGAELVKISLLEQAGEDAQPGAQYRVEDVTIYELDGTQEKRLSAIFTAHAMVHIFAEALNDRDLVRLRQSSTSDFNRRVWEHPSLDGLSLSELPLDKIDSQKPEIISTVFQGAVTEVTVTQGSRAMTYVLHDQNGRILVDDVLIPVAGRPNSLKQTIRLVLPFRQFVRALSVAASPNQDARMKGIRTLQRHSSKDFNRLVWHQVEKVPDIGIPLDVYLGAPLSSIRTAGEQAVLVLGDEQRGARIGLVTESDEYVIDDILLVAGSTSDRQLELKKRLRTQLLEATRNRTAPSTTRDIGAPVPDDAPESGPAYDELTESEPASEVPTSAEMDFAAGFSDELE